MPQTQAMRWPCSPRSPVADSGGMPWLTARFAVPRLADGPKVSLGVLWAISLLVAVGLSAVLVGVVLVPIAAVAGLQVAHSWSEHEYTDRWATALTAGALALSGYFGVAALGAAVLAITLALVAYAVLLPLPKGTNRIRLAASLILSAGPAGLASGCLLALAVDLPQAFVSLLVLVSAYEIGDFLIGSGAANAFEGPIAGLVGLLLVAVGLYLLLPHPFTTSNLPVYAAVAALGAPAGQFAASAILPIGTAWAPALRRLDSYLLVAPIWLLLF